MAIISLFPLFILVVSKLFKKLGYSVQNYKKAIVPYSLGFCLLIGMYYTISTFAVQLHLSILVYLSLLWLTGFLDDKFGQRYPKGLKGHLKYFVTEGKMTTGLWKLVITAVTAILVIQSLDFFLLNKAFAFLLLMLTPHIMNLLDTRPLRVWKSTILLVTFPAIQYFSSFSFAFTITIIVGSLMYMEGKQVAMLGDNGATLLGGIIATFFIHIENTYLSGLLVTFFLLVVIVTERISLSRWIDSKPLLQRFDRWGVSE